MQIVAIAVGGTALLLSIGAAQWLILWRFVRRAARWIWITAVAWLAGLTAFMLVATPLWQEGQPLALVVSVGVGNGLVMAATVATSAGSAIRAAALIRVQRPCA